MRIALFVPAFPKFSETFIVSKFLGLLEQGYDVYIVCNQSTSKDWDHFNQLQSKPELHQRVYVHWRFRTRWMAGVLLPLRLAHTLWSAPTQTLRYFARGIRRFRPLDLLRRFYGDAAIITAKPDVLHFEFGALAVERMYLKDLLGCKVITSFRGYDLNRSGLEHVDYYADVWKSADYLHLLGHALWERARTRGCPPDKPHVFIPPAIDLDFFRPAERPDTKIGAAERPLHLLSVGRLEWEKGYEHALQAVAMLREHGIEVEYRIAGEGDYLDPLAFAAHQLGLDEVVTFLGALPREAVRDQMRWADILLHAAVSEGFCNAVLEAQAMQLPVVCSDAGGLVENVEDGVTGFVVPRRNPAALAEKVRQLCVDPALRRQMGQAGRARVQKMFNLPDQIAAFATLYQQVEKDHA
jgi:colanic acid/amylovoran biosynthesis glycosyltransferase